MIIDLNQYPNLLDDINLSEKEILDQIKGYGLSFDQYKNEQVEWGMKLPMFLESFYPFVIEQQRVPSQEELWLGYRNQISIKSLLTSDNIERGIKARLYRSYPSLVRDLHFAIYLREKATSSTIIYNKKLDVEVGIDILVVFNEKYYAINLFTPTRRAIIGRSKKDYRHEKVENVINIDLPVDFNDQHKWGQFYLYGEKQLNQLREVFKKLK